MSKTVRNAVVGGLILVGIVLATSFHNAGKYTLTQTDTGLELWKGNFAPLGTHLVAKMDGITGPEITKRSYSKEEIFPIVCKALLDKVDDRLTAEPFPDFLSVKQDLEQAQAFAITADLKDAVSLRLNGINFWVSMYKADMAIHRGTLSDLEAAQGFLNEAATQVTFDYQEEILTMRNAAVETALAAAAGETLASEEAIPATEAKQEFAATEEEAVEEETVEEEAVEEEAVKEEAVEAEEEAEALDEESDTSEEQALEVDQEPATEEAAETHEEAGEAVHDQEAEGAGHH